VRDRTPLLVRVRVLPDVWKLDSKRALPVVVAALAEGAERFGMRIVMYRIEADRLLMVVEADDRDALTRGMQGFGIRFSKAINRMMGTEGTIFAERYHLQVLDEPDQTRRALATMLERPPAKASPPALGKLTDPRSRSLRNALSNTAIARLARRVPSVEPKLPKRRPAS
jgi:hypothetical protein